MITYGTFHVARTFGIRTYFLIHESLSFLANVFFCISIDAIRDFVIVFDSIHFCLTSTIVDLISVVEGFDDVLEDVNNPVRRWNVQVNDVGTFQF